MSLIKDPFFVTVEDSIECGCVTMLKIELGLVSICWFLTICGLCTCSIFTVFFSNLEVFGKLSTCLAVQFYGRLLDLVIQNLWALTAKFITQGQMRSA